MRLAPILGLALAIAGCQKANIQLHAPAGPTGPSATANNALHFGMIGVVELSSPVDVAAACNGSVDSIHEEVGVAAAIVDLVLGTVVPVFNVRNATVNCATGPAPAPAAPPAPTARR